MPTTSTVARSVSITQRRGPPARTSNRAWPRRTAVTNLSLSLASTSSSVAGASVTIEPSSIASARSTVRRHPHAGIEGARRPALGRSGRRGAHRRRRRRASPSPPPRSRPSSPARPPRPRRCASAGARSRASAWASRTPRHTWAISASSIAGVQLLVEGGGYPRSTSASARRDLGLGAVEVALHRRQRAVARGRHLVERVADDVAQHPRHAQLGRQRAEALVDQRQLGAFGGRQARAPPRRASDSSSDDAPHSLMRRQRQRR